MQIYVEHDPPILSFLASKFAVCRLRVGYGKRHLSELASTCRPDEESSRSGNEGGGGYVVQYSILSYLTQDNQHHLMQYMQQARLVSANRLREGLGVGGSDTATALLAGHAKMSRCFSAKEEAADW